MADVEKLREDLHSALADVLHTHEQMLVKWVLVAEVMDDSGERAVQLSCPQGQLIYESLGLLEFARQIEQASL